MKIGKTNAIFGGGVVYNFVPFVAPESFNDPKKYADFGLTVNLYEKFRIYKMTWAGADIAVEFSDSIASVTFTGDQVGTGATLELFETVSGVERSVLRTTQGTHTFTAGSTKRYMIRRVTAFTTFVLPVGSVWAYCFGMTRLTGYTNTPNPYLKYVFFYENTLTEFGFFQNTAITGVLKINGGITTIEVSGFTKCANLTKVITGNQLTTIQGNNFSGAFQQCTGLQVADLGTGLTSIGTDTFNRCTSLASIICRAYNPPTLATNAFRGIPSASPLITKFYVPNDRVAAYKAATGWISFASRIYSINDL